jgi:hypothetical protein
VLALKLVLSVVVVVLCSFGMAFAATAAQDITLDRTGRSLASAFAGIYALTIFIALPVIWAWL